MASKPILVRVESRRRPVALFVHGPRNMGGDSVAVLRAVQRMDHSVIDPIVVASPDCEAWDAFKATADATGTRIFGIDMGVQDTESGTVPRPAVDQALVTARALAKLIGLIRRQRVNVIYTLDRSRAVILATTAAKLTQRGLVFHAHWAYYPSSRVRKATVRAADIVIAGSEFIRREYVKLGIPDSQMRTVYNGVDLTKFGGAGDPASARAQLGISPEERMVLVSARLSRFKGQLELVEAMPAVLEKYPNTRFVCAGYDSVEFGDVAVPPGCATMGDVLRHRATELGVADRLLLPGAMSNIADLYQAADVVALPSWEEPMGLATLEAMSSGAAVVASRAGGVPEAVDDGDTGLLVPPRSPQQLAEGINRLLADPELRQRLGKAAQVRVRGTFTIDRYARDIQDTLIAAAR